LNALKLQNRYKIIQEDRHYQNDNLTESHSQNLRSSKKLTMKEPTPNSMLNRQINKKQRKY
jgi:hypothetical protein